ncbi:hypothetical protein EON66_03310 [archaeon]|nr:MAG: hypothetical protein EON66_03310 [archaeon]
MFTRSGTRSVHALHLLAGRCSIISFLVVLFHALLIVAEHIVDAGGRNLVGLANVNSGDTLIALTRCFETLACVHLVHAVLAGLHALPFVRSLGARAALRCLPTRTQRASIVLH